MNLTHLLNNLVSTLISKHNKLPFSFLVHTIEGKTIPIGEETPAFEVYICNQAGLKAVESLDLLTIAEAYLAGNINIEGDLIKALMLQECLSDQQFRLKAWRYIKPLLVGRTKCNPDWIAKHYDSNNIQLLATDTDYNTYTPGFYENDEDSLEVAAERKLASAFDSLNLKQDDSVLDIGCGWGGFLRYAARRNINVTGITLSHDQKQYTESLIKDNNFNAQVLYQDFFSWMPPQKYDGIVMMGVIEDLSDYPRVIKLLSSLVKPGGRVYLDFASSKESFGTNSFITKHVWPGRFRMVFMPQFIDAVINSPFEIININNDRRNYYLWSKKVNERWEQKKAEVIKQSSEPLWRMFRILYAGTASIMNIPTHYVTAYSVVLEYPADFVQG